MKGFIEIPTTEGRYPFLLNLAHVKYFIDREQSITIVYLDGKEEGVWIPYETLKKLVREATI